MKKIGYEQPLTDVFVLATESVILNNSPGSSSPGGNEGVGGGVDD